MSLLPPPPNQKKKKTTHHHNQQQKQPTKKPEQNPNRLNNVFCSKTNKKILIVIGKIRLFLSL